MYSVYRFSERLFLYDYIFIILLENSILNPAAVKKLLNFIKFVIFFHKTIHNLHNNCIVLLAKHC